MAQSLFKALKRIQPQASIDVLAPAWTRPLLERMPEVRQAIDMPVGHGMMAIGQRWHIGKTLRGQYQQAIVLPNSWKSALIPWFAKVPKRTGWRGEMRYGLLNDLRRLNKSALPLMVERFVSLAGPARTADQKPDWQAPSMIAGDQPDHFIPTKSPARRRLALCPGAEFGPAKQWPATYYAKLADKAIAAGWQVMIFGSKADRTVADQIVAATSEQAGHSIFNLAGKTALAEAIDLLATADQVVSNDSGLMHVAAALGKPLTAIYGPTSPAFTPPLSTLAKIKQIEVDCGPCFQRVCPQGHHKCMQQLTPDKVAPEFFV
ncbi:ADP-heptose--lipooligosaccharide heptosyltransferase II [Methylophaga frappieri]|uniref:lipopolysaccharide heptosyltransferase II n=2 Tax=Methylophaga frappieri (strain ATCC BAA-2434 / DSM 25690 / JAM7) TaxID=754477 RepID=I1YKE8_METFJ|nr:ADP-heptose--lipooligosaccharide heptosyltransferase II [Methylophaga frappieri]